MVNSDIKKERFKRVASKRVDKLLLGIGSLSKCSETNNYEYTKDDVQKMIKVLKEELKNNGDIV